MVTVRVNIISSNNPDVILRALREPRELFRDIPDIVSFKSYQDLGIHEVRIRLRRFLAVVIDTIHFSIKTMDNRVIYESLEPDKFKAVFSISEELGITRIQAEIFYEAPLRGPGVDVAVENIFRRFMLNLEERAPTIAPKIPTQEAIEEMPRKASDEIEKPIEIEITISCKTCLLYEESASICTYLMKKVESPEKPLCGGDKYIRASV